MVVELPPGTWMLLGDTHAYEYPYTWKNKEGATVVGSKGWLNREANDILVWDGKRLFFLWRNAVSWTDRQGEVAGGEVGAGFAFNVDWDSECGCWRMG